MTFPSGKDFQAFVKWHFATEELGPQRASSIRRVLIRQKTVMLGFSESVIISFQVVRRNQFGSEFQSVIIHQTFHRLVVNHHVNNADVKLCVLVQPISHSQLNWCEVA